MLQEEQLHRRQLMRILIEDEAITELQRCGVPLDQGKGQSENFSLAKLRLHRIGE